MQIMTIGDMGIQREYIESGGFSTYLYYQSGDTIVSSNGVEGKVVVKIEGSSYDGLSRLLRVGLFPPGKY